MYLVQNNHPAIISREVFSKAQEEFAKRRTLSPKSTKNVSSFTGKYSKYALSEVLICGECGSRYRRCTWVAGGQKRVVWRCISRLEYGKKYCSASLTVDEKPLQDAIVRALNRFSSEDDTTYLALMKATIGEALGLTGSSDEEDLLQRRIDALNSRMMTLVSENVKNGGSFDDCEDQFRDLNEQISQLKGRIEAIQKGGTADDEYKKKLEKIDSVIERRMAHQTVFDESIVRQMIECIKVFPDGKLQIYFGGDTVIEEQLQ